MKLETVYEIRTVIRGRIDRRIFVNSLPELHDKFRSIDSSTTVYVFKTVKDGDGNIISSNRLDCKIHNNGFVVKTIYKKPRRMNI